MSEEKIAALEAEIAALRKEVRLLAQYVGTIVYKTREDAGLAPITFGPDTRDDPEHSVARLYDGMLPPKQRRG